MYEIVLKYACPVSDIIAEDFLFMRIQLSEHFTYRKLLRFTLPSVIMMVCTSIYGVVDGVFVSNFVGSDAFAAVNLIMPFLMVLGAVGFMLGTGGSALVAYTLGAGSEKRANEIFSLLIYVLIGLGAVFTIGGIAFLTPMSRLLGADETMLPVCVSYGRIVLLGLIPYMLQNTFQSFLVTAERPQLGLYVTIAAGVTNIVLDALFVAVLQWGVEGAALATILSQFVGGAIPLVYFLRPNSSKLRLGRTSFHGRALLKACANGSSEFMTNISMSVVNMLYNWQLMRLMGSGGVAVYGVIMYVNFIFIAIFLGYSMGSAPIVGYHYGAGNRTELRGLLRKSLCIITVMSVVLTAAALLLARPLSLIFVSKEPALLPVTIRAFSIYSLSFLMVGHNIYASSFFTALNDGFISALISFARTLVFQVAAVIVLPVLWGIDGVWAAAVGGVPRGQAEKVRLCVRRRGCDHHSGVQPNRRPYQQSVSCSGAENGTVGQRVPHPVHAGSQCAWLSSVRLAGGHGYGPLHRQFRFEEAGAGGHTDPVPRQWTAHLCLPDGTGASSGR